jgi:hypothetical protein
VRQSTCGRLDEVPVPIRYEIYSQSRRDALHQERDNTVPKKMTSRGLDAGPFSVNILAVEKINGLMKYRYENVVEERE